MLLSKFFMLLSLFFTLQSTFVSASNSSINDLFYIEKIELLANNQLNISFIKKQYEANEESHGQLNVYFNNVQMKKYGKSLDVPASKTFQHSINISATDLKGVSTIKVRYSYNGVTMSVGSIEKEVEITRPKL